MPVAFVDIKASKTLLILDACRNSPERGKGDEDNVLSEALTRGLKKVMTSPQGEGAKVRATLYACEIGKRAYEVPGQNRGFFSVALEKAFEGEADTGDGRITLNEVESYLDQKVPDLVAQSLGAGFRQRPWSDRSGSGAGDWVLSWSAAPPGPDFSSRGTLRISANMAAQISVDGVDYGQLSSASDVRNIAVSEGSHTVRGVAGNVSDQQTVFVVVGQEISVSLSLESAVDPISPPNSTGATGALYIRSDPEGATVWIGGREVGETPTTAKNLAVGPHRVRVVLEDYHPWDEVVRVIPEVKWLEPISLRPNFGSLKVASEPSGALVYLNEVQVKRTPFIIERKKSGIYQARLVLEWYHDWEGELMVRDGLPTDKTVTMQPAFGALTVRSEPDDARVFLDGDSVGTTPLSLARVRSGMHRVRVEKDLYASWEQTLTMTDGGRVPLRVLLEARFGGLSVRSQPSGMPVEVDGKAVGHTPVTLHPIGVGQHRVVIGKGIESHHVYEGDHQVRANQTEPVTKSLLPKLGNLTLYSEPAEGVVYVDGEEARVDGRLAMTPTTLRGLLSGSHKILVKKGDLIYEGEVWIKEGVTETQTVELTQPFGGGEMVYVSDFGFYIDKYEVTNAAYAEFVESTGHRASSYASNTDFNGDRHPVVGVSWEDARAYCAWAGKRLPTEEEWQHACEGTDGRTYPWGNEAPNSHLANYDGDVGKTTEVGKYPPGASPYGALDMSGNVWEWVGSSSGPNRGLRGGSWGGTSYRVRCAGRPFSHPHSRFNHAGFRCARNK